jgi:hypothetical protein
MPSKHGIVGRDTSSVNILYENFKEEVTTLTLTHRAITSASTATVAPIEIISKIFALL